MRGLAEGMRRRLNPHALSISPPKQLAHAASQSEHPLIALQTKILACDWGRGSEVRQM